MTSRLDLGTDLCDALDRVSMTDGIVLNTQEGPPDVDVHFLIRKVDQDAREPVQNFPHYLSLSAQKSQAIYAGSSRTVCPSAPATDSNASPQISFQEHKRAAPHPISSQHLRPNTYIFQLLRPKHGKHLLPTGSVSCQPPRPKT
jgi:hypothetical protein